MKTSISPSASARVSQSHAFSIVHDKNAVNLDQASASTSAKPTGKLCYSLGTTDPWPDQGMNKMLTLAESLNPSDIDQVEWLAMLFYLASPRSDVQDLAERALEIYGSFGKVFSRPSHELQRMLGLDSSCTTVLKVAKTCMQLALAEELPSRQQINSHAALMDYLALDLRHAEEERLRVLYLDQKCRLIRDEELARGTNDRVQIYPKEIAKRAAAYCASSVVMAHNHLADDPTPSPADIQATLRTKGALEFFDILLQDHVIVARNHCLSMREQELL